MSTVVLHFSMSLDGYVAGPDVSMQHPLGRGGEALHEWMSGTEADREIARSTSASVGAVVLGRRTFRPPPSCSHTSGGRRSR